MPASGRTGRAAAGPRGEGGMVTAETAVVLPVLVLVTVLALGAIWAVAAQMRCLDAATVAARLAARGEPAEAVRAAVRVVAPAGAAMAVRRAEPASVVVEVSAALRLPGLGGFPGARVRASFQSPLEPGVGGAVP